MNKLPEIKNSGQFKLDDSSSYDSYADDYHRCVDRLCEPFVKQMVTLAHLKTGYRVLDVGTGTGIVANYAANLLDNSSSVVGIDLSEGMLETAALNAKKKDISNVKFLRMDAENLGLPAGFFDSILSMYAIDHFPDAAKALGEMYRVLKPEGRLVISIGCGMPPWGGGRLKAYYVGINRKIKQCFQPHLYAPNFILSLMNKQLGHLSSPSHSSWGGTNQENNLIKLIKAAGFNIMDLFWWHNMIPIQSTEEFWRSQTALVTEVRKQLMNADPDTKESFYLEFKNLADSALSRGGMLYYCAAALVISSTRKKL